MRPFWFTALAINVALPLPTSIVPKSSLVTVLVPIYWYYYGPTNFLYFCDVALLLTLAGVWLESGLLISMAAVGILIPQAFWVVDFTVRLTGHSFTGMTDYMFDANRSRFLRGLSFFHGWLPFLLVYLVRKFRTRADDGVVVWATVTAFVITLFFFAVMLVAAMVPMALGEGPGAASRAGMAKLIMGGQALSLILTLLIVPIISTFWDDIGTWWKGRPKPVVETA